MLNGQTRKVKKSLKPKMIDPVEQGIGLTHESGIELGHETDDLDLTLVPVTLVGQISKNGKEKTFQTRKSGVFVREQMTQISIPSLPVIERGFVGLYACWK